MAKQSNSKPSSAKKSPLSDVSIKKDTNINIRPIKNGFLTTTSVYSRKDGYKEEVVYTEKHPLK